MAAQSDCPRIGAGPVQLLHIEKLTAISSEEKKNALALQLADKDAALRQALAEKDALSKHAIEKTRGVSAGVVAAIGAAATVVRAILGYVGRGG